MPPRVAACIGRAEVFVLRLARAERGAATCVWVRSMGLDVLYLLIPASVVLALVAFGLFIWAIRSGQFDDLDTPAIRILMDEPPPPGAARKSPQPPVRGGTGLNE